MTKNAKNFELMVFPELWKNYIFQGAFLVAENSCQPPWPPPSFLQCCGTVYSVLMLAGTQKSLLQKNIQHLSLMNCLGHYSSVFSLLGIRTIASLQHLEFPWNLLSRRLVLKDILRSVLHTTEQGVSLHFAVAFCPDYKNKSNSCCLSWTHPCHMTENLHQWKLYQWFNTENIRCLQNKGNAKIRIHRYCYLLFSSL